MASFASRAMGATWREDNRRMSNGDQVMRLANLVTRKKSSPDFTGYWQRHVRAD
jgi:hypothetical protein